MFKPGVPVCVALFFKSCLEGKEKADLSSFEAIENFCESPAVSKDKTFLDLDSRNCLKFLEALSLASGSYFGEKTRKTD